MLRSLSIRNVALIERADLTFSEGLNVLSGETGAGKSVILDSIDFVLGAKADKSMIRSGETECSVRAEFDAGENLRPILEEFDIEADDTIVISRKLTAEGRGSAKVNGCAVTAAMLKTLTSRLVDIHGQSEHFFLLKESNQLRLLDRISDTDREKGDVGILLAERKGILSRLGLLGGDESERSRRLDILRFQIDEIERAALKEGEEEELVALRNKYRDAEKILTELNAARECLSGENGGNECVLGARRALLRIRKYEEYAALADRLENVAAELADIGDAVEGYAEELDLNEGEAERVENRLDEIGTVKKKYGGSVAAALGFLADARTEFALLTDGAAQFEELSSRLSETDEKLYLACVKLTEARKNGAKGFCKRVTDELKTLNIASAKFEVEFDGYTREDVGRATADGLDKIRFLFSANAGEPLKELGKIISGGEMSRFMLAVKAQLSATDGIGTYLFDEIDAGIGGKTAKTVAEKFCKIAESTQLIAVSHLEKREENGRTHTTVRELLGTERRDELARLISGEKSELALRHADELIQTASEYKNSLRRTNPDRA